jgi:hypothetical protein
MTVLGELLYCFYYYYLMVIWGMTSGDPQTGRFLQEVEPE